jgi:hypothetical protein
LEPNFWEDFIANRYHFFILFFLAYATSLIAFTRKSLIWLRGLIAISSSFFALYYLLYPIEPLWLDIVSEAGVVLVNVIMIIILIRQNRGLHFKEEEKDLYQAFFSGFSPFEFIKLNRLAKWNNYPEDFSLTKYGESVQSLFFLYDGHVKVYQDDKQVGEIFPGSFIGEISFTLGKDANATVITSQMSRVIEWTQNDLKDLLDRNPGMRNIFNSMITTDLAKKLSVEK